MALSCVSRAAKSRLANALAITGEITDVRIDFGGQMAYIIQDGEYKGPAKFVASGGAFETHVCCRYHNPTAYQCGVSVRVWNPDGNLVHDSTDWDEWPYEGPEKKVWYFSHNIAPLNKAGEWKFQIAFWAFPAQPLSAWEGIGIKAQREPSGSIWIWIAVGAGVAVAGMVALKLLVRR